MRTQLKEMIADAADNDRRLTESELFAQQMQKVCCNSHQLHVQVLNLTCWQDNQLSDILA